MSVRPSTCYLAATSALAVLLAEMLLHAALQAPADGAALERKRAAVRRLSLTDLCLFTEASYTRHPSVADLWTPFQDSPMALEHFPSGSLVQPPPHLAGTRHD